MLTNAFCRQSGTLSNVTGIRLEPLATSFSISFPSLSYTVVDTPDGAILICSTSGVSSSIPLTTPSPRETPAAPISSRKSIKIRKILMTSFVEILLPDDTSNLCFFTMPFLL